MKQNSLMVWIIYDIVKNKSRTKIAKACKEAGLYRVQKSVFLGCIERNRLDELSMRIEKHIDEENDSVYMFPLCETDFKKVITMGQAFDRDLVNDEIHALFI